MEELKSEDWKRLKVSVNGDYGYGYGFVVVEGLAMEFGVFDEGDCELKNGYGG